MHDPTLGNKLELAVLNTEAILSIREWLLQSLVQTMNGQIVTEGDNKPYVVSCSDGLLFVLCLYLPGGSEVTAFPNLPEDALIGSLRDVWENHRSVNMTIMEVIQLAQEVNDNNRLLN